MHAQLLTNHWFGKAVGATCAWIWAPADPMWIAVAVICGITLGHIYDLWANHLEQKAEQRRETQNLKNLGRSHRDTTSPNTPQVQYLFTALGRVAKAGGRVTPEHVAYAEQLMQKMEMHSEARREAQQWFSQGKKADCPFQSLAKGCMGVGEQASEQRLISLRCLCHMAAIETTNETLTTLKTLGGYLGFTPGQVGKEFGHAHNPSPASKPPADSEADQKLQAAYETLGIQPGTSAANVKLAYRKKVSQHHPDKLPRDADALQRQKSQAKMIALREALERIEASQS